MTIAIISHPDCVLHDASSGHPEQPDRVRVIQTALERYPFQAPVAFHEAPLASREQLISVHDQRYVDWIMSISPADGKISLDEDTAMNPFTLQAALRAAGAAVLAVDMVMKKDAQTAFCNVRPPGHHAETGKAMGFCFFNNVAVGVMHALTAYQLERVAIIDFDVHHGNGTQAIFQQDKRVLLCSSFEHPFYPGYDAELDNEHILNVPLAAGTTGEIYRERIEAAWFEKLAAFKPQMIFFSAGFDGHLHDPIGEFKLTEADYVWLTMHAAQIAKSHAQGRMVSMLEGGYNLDVLAQCVPAHVNAMVV